MSTAETTSTNNAAPVEPGVVLGLGGTNARIGIYSKGDILGFVSEKTPAEPAAFFRWMARKVLKAVDAGKGWLVAGFPGPVSRDGKLVGPLTNVPGLANDRYDLLAELTAVDPAIGRLVRDEGFLLVGTNDGPLAAQAAAGRVGQYRYDRTAALIVGTGVGAGIVMRDATYHDVYRTDKSPTEIGHLLLSADPADTFENTISGSALARRYGKDARELPAYHPAWKEVGQHVGRLAMTLGLMQGVELVVPCGGVGAGAYDYYATHLDDIINEVGDHGNGPQNLFLPSIIPVPNGEAQIFELYGGAGVVRDFRTPYIT